MSATILKFTPRRPFGDLSKDSLMRLEGVEAILDVGERLDSTEPLWIVRIAHDRVYNIRTTQEAGEYSVNYIDLALELNRHLGTFDATEVITMVKMSAIATPARLGCRPITKANHRF